jgi:O-antigen/teichoic acid export membrane protein
MALLWKLSDWRPRARFSRELARQLFGFSSRVLLSKLGVFAHRRSDALILGYFFGPVALALYRMAERLMQLVIELSTRPVAQVALPNFARLQGDPAALRDGVATTLKTSSILGIPALVGLAAVSGPLVGLLGEEWRHTAPVLQILCALGAARTLTLFTGSLLQAIGRPGLMAAMTWSLALVNIAAFTAAGMWLRALQVLDQIRAIAAVRTGIFALLYSPTNLVLLLWFSGNTPWRLLRVVLPSLCGAASVLVAVLGVRMLLAGALLPEVAALLAQVAVGGVAGLVTLHAIDADFRGQLAALLERARGKAVAEPIHPGQSRD